MRERQAGLAKADVILPLRVIEKEHDGLGGGAAFLTDAGEGVGEHLLDAPQGGVIAAVTEVSNIIGVIRHGEVDPMTQKTTHVVPNPDGGWDVKQGGAESADKHFDTKQDAVDWGRDQSRGRGSEFYIHGLDGRIQQKDSHGNDDDPPEG